MKLKYRVRYSRTTSAAGGTMPCTEDVYGVSAVSALGGFHRRMQLERHLGSDRKTVLRPKLKPDEYSVTSMALLFNSDPTGRGRGEIIESAFDIPDNSRNPDLRKEPEAEEEPVMPFMASIGPGRLSK